MALFGKDRFFDIKEPEQIFKALTKRKYWNSMRPVLLQRILENTKASPITLMDFVMISEQYDLVKPKFISASAIPKEDDALSTMSFTLFSLADNLIAHFATVPKDSEEAQLWFLIPVALESSILCDPLQLNAYGTLGWFLYRAKLTEKAISVCQRYDGAEGQLLQTENDVLSIRHKIAKGRIDEVREIIASLKKELGLPCEQFQEDARNKIDALRKELDSEGGRFCFHCGQTVAVFNPDPEGDLNCPKCGWSVRAALKEISKGKGGL